MLIFIELGDPYTIYKTYTSKHANMLSVNLLDQLGVYAGPGILERSTETCLPCSMDATESWSAVSSFGHPPMP